MITELMAHLYSRQMKNSSGESPSDLSEIKGNFICNPSGDSTKWCQRCFLIRDLAVLISFKSMIIVSHCALAHKSPNNAFQMVSVSFQTFLQAWI